MQHIKIGTYPTPESEQLERFQVVQGMLGETYPILIHIVYERMENGEIRTTLHSTIQFAMTYINDSIRRDKNGKGF